MQKVHPCFIGISIALCVLTVTAYWGLWNHDFILYDDPWYVTQNQRVLQGITTEGLAWAFTHFHSGNWHPLTWISLMLDAEWSGNNAFGYLITNLALHTVNVLLTLVLIWRLTSHILIAAMVAALLAVHPLHVESVAWVTERKDVLSMFFFLLTLLSYLRYVADPGKMRYLQVLILFALGLMSKQMLVTLPLVLLILDYWPLRRSNPALRNSNSTKFCSPAIGAYDQQLSPWYLLREKTPLLLTALLAGSVTLFAQVIGHAVQTLDTLSLSARLENTVTGYSYYLWKVFWPTDLVVFVPHAALTGTEGTGMPAVLAAAAILVTVSVLAFRMRNTHPFLLVGWLWFVIVLLPVSGILQAGLQGVADRFMYIPSIGLYMAITLGYVALTKRLRPPRLLIVAIPLSVLVALVFVTRTQVSYWQNSMTLFSRAVEVHPENPIAHNILGVELMDHNELSQAEQHFKSVLQTEPTHIGAHFNLARLYVKRHEYNQARHHYEQVVALSPTMTDARYRLATLLNNTDDCSSAEPHFRAVLSAQPDHTGTLNGLAWLLSTCSDSDLRNGTEAVQLAERACRLTERKNPNYLDTLAVAYAETGRFDQAIETELQALQQYKKLGNRQDIDRLRAQLARFRNGQGIAP